MRRRGILLALLLVASFIVLPGQATARDGNPTIHEMQKRLEISGFNPGPIDGLWGGRTERALNAFQKEKGLRVTGRLDGATRKKLGVKGAVVELLFYYAPDCSHGSWQRPTVAGFQRRHPEVIVTWRKGKELKRAERKLIAGTKGNPVMTFHAGENVMSIVGTAMLEGLEAYLTEFQGSLREARSTGSPISSIRGSGVACK